MTSKSKEPTSKEPTSKEFDLVERDAEQNSGVSDIEALDSRVDQLSKSYEDFRESRNIKQETQKKLRDYIDSAREEIDSLKKFRIALTIGAGVMSLLFVAGAIWIIVCSPNWFDDLENAHKFYTILLFVASPVLLVTAMLRGVYRSHHERVFGQLPSELVQEGVRHIQD